MDEADLQELQKDTFVVVVFIVGVLAATLFYILLVAQWPTVTNDPVDYQYWWLPPLLALGTCLVSYRAYKRNRFRPGTYLFVGGLTLTVVSFMFWPNSQFNQLQVYLLLLVVAIAGLLISPQAAAQVALFASLITLSTAIGLKGFSWQTIYPLIVPLLMTGAMALTSWISSNHLITAMSWAMHSQERAHERTRQLYESQKEIQKAYQLLETTNIRLREAEAAAVKANELKTRFITNLSHELRTPLNAIINFSYILTKHRHGVVTPEQADYLNRIHNSGELLLQIVNDLLDLAKIEAGQMDLLREAVDLAAVSQSILPTISGLINDKPIQLRQEVAANLPKVWGDETRIRQVLLNLLGNAAKYTEEGMITLRISNKRDNFLMISVIDTGIGIKEQDFERIFEEFQQTEEAFALRKVGTGLGLPISKRFIELHGGQLWLESEVGRGSAFHFTLPIISLPQPAQGHPYITPQEAVKL
jgi:signal transduction histidine kinase